MTGSRAGARLVPASAAHAEVVAAILSESLPQAWDAEALSTLFDMPGVFGWLSCEADDGPVAAALARVAADEAELLAIATRPAARRRGHARGLLAAVIRGARERGAVRLFLEVARDNFAAHDFYLREQFSPMGTRQNYYRDDRKQPQDAILLSLTLISDGRDGC